MATSNDFVKIASGNTISSPIGIQIDCAVVSFQIPAAFTGATVNIQGSLDGVTYGDVVYSGSTLSFSVSPGKVYQVPPSATIGIEFFRIVSSSAETADRVIFCSSAKVV